MKHTLDDSIMDDIFVPYKNSIPAVIQYSLEHDRGLNLYRFMEYKGFHDYLIRLDDYMTIIGIELFINCLDANGVFINDTPNYREMMTDFFADSGITFQEEMYDVVGDALDNLTKIISKDSEMISETYILIRFLKAAEFYTNIKYIISKMYHILAKYYQSIIRVEGSIDNIESLYSDVVNFTDICSDIPIFNECVLEYISGDIVKSGLYNETFLQFSSKSETRDIYKILTGG